MENVQSIKKVGGFRAKFEKVDFQFSDFMNIARLCYIGLMVYSMICNFRMGWSLAFGWMAFAQGVAFVMIDLACLAFLKYAQEGHSTAWLGFVLCLLLAIFTGWSFQCEMDAMQRSGLNSATIDALGEVRNEAKSRENNVPDGHDANKLVAGRDSLNATKDWAAAIMVAEQSLGYPPAHAIFYEFSFFADDPEGSMVTVRSIFTIMIILCSVWLPAYSWKPKNTVQMSPNPGPGGNKGPDDSETVANQMVAANQQMMVA